MSLARYAFAPRFPFWRDVDELFREVPQSAAQTVMPAADVRETDKAVEIHLDMPGITAEQIDVKLEGDQLTITSTRTDEKTVEEKGWIRRERSQGNYSRAFTLADTLDGTKPEATYRNGVLMVTIPKREVAQPRSFKVKVEA
jgi:HSP20 family protein